MRLWFNILAIAIGGAIGSVSRYAITSLVNRVFFPGFPWGVFLANMIGCLLIGLLAGYFVQNQHIQTFIKLGLIVGFLGGLTTFSSFSLDNFHLIKMGEYIDFILNVSLSVVVGLIMTTVGMAISMKLLQ